MAARSAELLLYCEACRAARGWPGLATSAYGPCQECGAYAVLHRARRSDLVPYEPSQAERQMLDHIRQRIAMLPPEAVFTLGVADLRRAFWVKRELSDVADRLIVVVAEVRS